MPVADALVHLGPEDLAAGMAADVRSGLTATPKVLTPKYFYDARGSELFDQITRLPEYYPTRTETAILRAHAGDIAAATGAETLTELGSTIGNLEPAARARFLAAVRASLDDGDAFLLGVDLVKSEQRLVAAYDDQHGVTAAFNKNILAVLDRELGADFDPDTFEHRAVWNAREEWIEMHLVSRREQTVRLPALDLVVGFAAGETLRTEISAKFRHDGVEAELVGAGLRPARWWTDPAGDFGISLSLPV